MPCRAINVRALAMRCSRSAVVIAGGIGIAGSSVAASADRRSSGSISAAARAPPVLRNDLRWKVALVIPSPLGSPATVARPGAIGQQARPMFDSLAHDGVKRPGTREMTVLLAGLMALNAFAI